MKLAADLVVPRSSSHAHARHNFIRNELEMQRCDEIERDNNHLLGKIDVATRPSEPCLALKRSSSLPLLTPPPSGFARKREENWAPRDSTRLPRQLLRTPPGPLLGLERMGPLLLAGVAATSGSPPATSRSPPRRGAPREPARPSPSSAAQRQEAAGRGGAAFPDLPASGGPAAGGSDFRYVVSREMSLGCWPHFVEVATDGRILCVIACRLDTKEAAELVVGEEDHSRLLDAADGDYEEIVRGLRMRGGALILEEPDASPNRPSSRYRKGTSISKQSGSTDSCRCVLSKEMTLGFWPYFVELATDEKVLYISACKMDTKEVIDLLVSEENHAKLQEAANGDYKKIIKGLRLDGGVLRFKQLDSL